MHLSLLKRDRENQQPTHSEERSAGNCCAFEHGHWVSGVIVYGLSKFFFILMTRNSEVCSHAVQSQAIMIQYSFRVTFY